MSLQLAQPSTTSPGPSAGIAIDARPAPYAGVTALPLDDELVLYVSGSDQAYTLNATAAQIWALCDGSRTFATVAGELAASYGLDFQQALDDVHELLGDLRHAGLLALH